MRRGTALAMSLAGVFEERKVVDNDRKWEEARLKPDLGQFS